MKEVKAIIRPGRWLETRKELEKIGILRYTTCRVQGRGRQKGLRYLGRRGVIVGVRYVPKRLVTLWLHEGDVERVVKMLITVNRTGQIGDGKIFVSPAEDVIRLRTGDRGELALA